jgi:hypothetical protein
VKAFDFTQFEEELYPEWESMFRIGGGTGEFSYVKGGKPCPYGTLDVIFCRAIMNRLTLTEKEKNDWASYINSFQQKDTGWYKKTYTLTHFREHTTAYAVAGLHLIDRKPAYDFIWQDRLLSSEKERQRWINKIPWSLSWPASHIVSGIPAIMAMLGNGTDEFFNWYFAWLDKEVNPATGYWSRGLGHRLGLIKKVSKHEMGSAFHMYYVYEYMNRKWPYPEKIVDMTLRLQHENGLWDRDVTYCIDLDGVYSLLRSSRNAGGYRTDDVKDACIRYLERAEKILNDREFFYSRYTNTHILPGALCAVAECAKFYPELVRTSRPWFETLDKACFI